MIGRDVCVKECQPPKKAPVFKIGDIVADPNGNIFSVNCVSLRWGSLAYAFIQNEENLNSVRWHTGHDLRHMSVVKKK